MWSSETHPQRFISEPEVITDHCQVWPPNKMKPSQSWHLGKRLFGSLLLPSLPTEPTALSAVLYLTPLLHSARPACYNGAPCAKMVSRMQTGGIPEFISQKVKIVIILIGVRRQQLRQRPFMYPIQVQFSAPKGFLW